MEEWKDIIGYKGLYQVSNIGRVKSLKYGKERILRGGKDRYGYLHVTLYKDGKAKCHRVHRLVAQAFLPNPLNLLEVNHKDENKENNTVSNLEWVSAKENCNYGTRNERRAAKQSKPVLQLTLNGQLVREWPSMNEAQRLGGYNQGKISLVCVGKRNIHKGYKWKYKETA